ncbi:NADH:flavin oxidoreductase/NADH oxidase [Ralstonia solanacearum]|uniref:NADH:flavin oxidoreductase/NADH oxidase n=1 Tax=Ralstonia solanacearum TaxID=305 RepID=UPI0035134B0B
MSALFQPFSLRGLQLDNRIVVSPMCQYSADRGQATAWHQTHLGALSLSGAALLMIEATAVSPEGRITPGCLGLWDDATEAALAGTLAAIRPYAQMPIGIQIAHAGRKASSARPWEGGALLPVESGGWETIGPSAVPQRPEERPPRAMNEADLARVCDAFVATARRAVRLGLAAIELHAAHGYLLHEFLSPIANQRTDAYGGSRENRMRYPLEVFEAVRAAVPDPIPVGVRMSCTDWVEGGWTLEDSVTFAQALRARGCDWVDASSGGVSPLQQIPLSTGYQVPFAEAIRCDAGMPTIAVGLINAPHEAEAIIAEGHADLVAMGRAFLYNPHWAWMAAADLGATVKAPPQYWRAFPRHAKDLFGETHFGAR